MGIKRMHTVENMCGRYAKNVTKTEQSFKKTKQNRTVGISHNTAKSQNQKKIKKKTGDIFIVDQTNILIIWKQKLRIKIFS
jgi:hypothetical protein